MDQALTNLKSSPKADVLTLHHDELNTMEYGGCKAVPPEESRGIQIAETDLQAEVERLAVEAYLKTAAPSTSKHNPTAATTAVSGQQSRSLTTKGSKHKTKKYRNR